MSTAVRPIRRRATFTQLKRPSGRGSAGPVQVRYLRPGSECPDPRPAVAFTVGHRSGNAVTRNRIRRRLRAALRQIPPGTLRPGSYLVGADRPAASLSYPALVDCLEQALTGATGVADARAARPAR